MDQRLIDFTFHFSKLEVYCWKRLCTEKTFRYKIKLHFFEKFSLVDYNFYFNCI